MAVPVALLLLGVGVVVAATSSSSSSPKKKKKPKTPIAVGVIERGPTIAGISRVAAALPSFEKQQLIEIYGKGNTNDYPAPYDWKSCERVAFWMTARFHYQQDRKPWEELVRQRFARIRGSSMTARQKVQATIWEVIVPAFGYSLLWRWAADTGDKGDLERGVRQKKMAAVLTWLGFWALGPETSTVTRSGAGYVPAMQANLESKPYRIEGDTMPAPNASARRDVLLAMHQTIRDLACFTYGSANQEFYCQQLRAAGYERVTQIATQYAELEHYDDGNLMLIKELVALGVTNNSAYIKIQLPSKGDMIFRLVINVVAILAAAVAPFAAGALAAASAAVGAAVEAAAAAVIGEAAAAGIGSYVSLGIQAAIGAAVAWVLEEQDILEGVAKGTEIGQMVATGLEAEDEQEALKAAGNIGVGSGK